MNTKEKVYVIDTNVVLQNKTTLNKEMIEDIRKILSDCF